MATDPSYDGAENNTFLVSRDFRPTRFPWGKHRVCTVVSTFLHHHLLTRQRIENPVTVRQLSVLFSCYNPNIHRSLIFLMLECLPRSWSHSNTAEPRCS